MNKQTIITAFPTFGRLPVAFLLALVALAGQAKTYKTIKTPVAMACVNVSNGELKAREVISVPSDWFKTDTITIRGRIEGYDAEKFGFTSMECYFQDIFEKEDATLVLDIDDDGTFYKKFLSSYPVCQRFYTMESKVDFREMFFYARPGETVDITVQKNADGCYECVYHNGSSHEVERWLNRYA